MLSWKVILQALAIVILAILVFFFFVPTSMKLMDLKDPALEELKEEIRCHLYQKNGICLSLYPNPIGTLKTVEVTFRTRQWYNNQNACIARSPSSIPVVRDTGEYACCWIENGKCRTDFTASSTGLYYVFIDTGGDEQYNSGIDPEGEERKLIVN